jgi:ACR3 family arsenite efflux pump ArsB
LLRLIKIKRTRTDLKETIHNPKKLDLMKKILFLSMFFYWLASPLKTVIPAWVPYDETEEVAKLPMHPQKCNTKLSNQNSR